jgi:hypothetical protein
MLVRWHWDREPIRDIDESLDRYEASEFQSPTRSTVPLISILKHGSPCLDSIIEGLISPEHEVSAHLEFRVKPPLGVGEASHTDLMLITPQCALAVEAKWTEPPYPSVATWNAAKKPNRAKVLRGWLSLVGAHLSAEPKIEAIEPCTYQMVHRTASACALARRPLLLYLQFVPLPDGRMCEPHLTNAMEKLHVALEEHEKIRMVLATVRIKPTEAFAAIENLPKNSPETAIRVKAALRASPLFEFVDTEIREFI